MSKTLELSAYTADHVARQQRLVGLIMLGVGGVFLFLGVPLLYAGGGLSIDTVNNLGRFLSLAIVALGADLVWGYTGILSLCQAMFFCIGGYAIGMHMAFYGPLDGDGIPRCLFVVDSSVGGMTLPWFWKPFHSLPVAISLALLIPGVIAFLFGFFTFRSRVRGVYFSIITQAITLAMVNVFCMNNMKLCGTNGLTNFVTLGGFDLNSSKVKLGLYMITATVLALTYLACDYLARSRAGRLLVAVRDGESRLRFAGYQPVSFKVFVFVFAAVIGGIGGLLYTPQNMIITPFKMDPIESIIVIACVAVGGRGTLSGAVVGTLVVSYLRSFLTSGLFYKLVPGFLYLKDGEAAEGFGGVFKSVLKTFLGPDAWYFALGAIFIVITLFFPEGIVGGWRKLVAWSLERYGKKKSASTTFAAEPMPAKGAS